MTGLRVHVVDGPFKDRGRPKEHDGDREAKMLAERRGANRIGNWYGFTLSLCVVRKGTHPPSSCPWLSVDSGVQVPHSPTVKAHKLKSATAAGGRSPCVH